MQCSVCGSENRELAKFCGGCGVLLALNCPECGADNSPTNKFCDSCGTTLQTESVDAAGDPVDSSDFPPTSPDDAPETAANRRQMSLLCVDLVDSSILARKLDPEDLRYALNNFHQISRDIIDEYEGYYAQYMGDGFMSYFSYPVAHENDAYRAVLTGLRIVEEIQKFNIELKEKHGIELHVRIGVNTGAVIVDDKVVGEAPNIASRVQTAARPDTVVITETTKRLLPPNAFTYQDLGVHEMKNIEPQRLFRVFERRGSIGRTTDTRLDRPLVGRDRQLDLLLEHWNRVKGSEGQAVIVAGEAGIGKTKLIQGFEAAIGDGAHMCLKFQGSPFHRNTMLHPVIEHIQLAAKFLPADSDAEKLAKLRVLLAQFDHPDKLLPLVSRLLSVSGQEEMSLVSPQRLRRQTLDILIDMALQHASRGPTLFIVEDMHWFDSTTMDLLELLMPLIGNERIFLIMTTRSSFTAQLQENYYLTQITLIRLQSNEVEAMIQGITGGKALPESVQAQIASKANGVPLYVEELTKMVLEADFIQEKEDQYELIAEPELAIPLTLRDPLTSRLDRVKEQKVLQLAATLGRTFPYQLLSAVSSLDKQDLARELQQLVAAELLYQKGSSLEEATFEFKHALIRDAAYSLLTKADRESYHQQIGQVLEERFPATVDAHPEIVAYHYAEARNCEKAVHYWYEAGSQSSARSAHTEAVGHLKQGMSQLLYIEDPVLRNKWELLLQTALGNSLHATKGWSVDSVKHAYTRALQLSKENGFDELTFSAMFGLWTWNFVRGTFDEAQTLAEGLLSITEVLDDLVYKVLAHESQGFTLFAQGNFTGAHAELRRSLSMCRDDESAAYLNLSAQDPRVHVRLYDGKALWFLGYPDQALQSCAEAQRCAEAMQHPFSQAMAQTISLRVHQFRGEVDNVAAQAAPAIAFCQEHEFLHYLAMAQILGGWASAQQGDVEHGIAEIQSGLAKQRTTGAVLYETYVLALLAEAYIKGERYKHALNCLEQAKQRLKGEKSERFYAAEIQRLCGEVYLRSHQDPEQAERCFREGLEIARKQEAKSLELKLSMSLYDLYASKHNANHYRQQLDEIYKSFDEGFDTANLVQAKTRLANAG